MHECLAREQAEEEERQAMFDRFLREAEEKQATEQAVHMGAEQ